MTIVVRASSSAAVWAQCCLFGIATGLLGYCGFLLTDSWMFQLREAQAFERLLPTAALAPSVPESLSAIGPDGLVGRLEIARLGVSVMVVEGAGKPSLQHAAGHIPQTAFPGRPGNVGIAAHRDTFFRPLQHIQTNDILTLTTLSGEYRYSVVSTKIVSPDDVAVLDPDGNEVLTLVTCYPFYFAGPAPSRFIVRAERMRNTKL